MCEWDITHNATSNLKNAVLIELIEWWTTKFQDMYLPLYMDLDINWSMYVYINVTMDFKSRDRNNK